VLQPIRPPVPLPVSPAPAKVSSCTAPASMAPVN
jgi:hypothetical protein